LLKRAEVVVRIQDVAFPDNAPRWFHLAVINLKSWNMRLLPLERLTDIEDPVFITLKVIPTSFEWRSVWDALEYIDLESRYDVDFWVISGQHSVKLDVFAPGDHIEVRQFSRSEALWAGRISQSKRVLVERDDCPAPIMDEPTDGERDDDDDVDRPPGVHSDSDDLTEGDRLPIPPRAPAPAIPAAVVVEPLDVGLGDAAVRGGRLVRRGRGRGARGAAASRNSNVVIPVPSPTDPGQVYGRITINGRSQSLDSSCARCGATADRKYTVRPNRFEANQGRPMGTHLAWLIFECSGDKAFHESFWNDSDLSHEDRKFWRDWGVGLGVFTDCFDLERPKWDREADDEPDKVA
jgi:hypothetical protein